MAGESETECAEGGPGVKRFGVVIATRTALLPLKPIQL